MIDVAGQTCCVITEMFYYITWAQKEKASSIPCQVEVIHMPQLLLL